LSKKPQIRQAFVGYSTALKFGLMLVLPVFCGLFAGIFLDRTFGTAPWFMLMLMLFSIIFGPYAVYRVATRRNKSGQNKEVD